MGPRESWGLGTRILETAGRSRSTPKSWS